MIRVTVWNENYHETRQKEVAEIYPEGMHGCIKAFLEEDAQIKVRTATFDEPEHGLTEEVLEQTDVLVYWSHWVQEEFLDEVAERIQKHVLRGMGLVALHSAHYSKMMKKLMGTSMSLRWRHGDRERLFVTAPTHPIAKGIPPYFELPVEEMYGEFFDIPKPDDVIFTGWFAGGEVFRSGCTFTRGNGKIFYFQPGHESYPTYHQPVIQQIIKNAVNWCAPADKKSSDYDCTHVMPPLEKDAEKMKLSVFYEHIREASEQTGRKMEELFSLCPGAGITGIEMEYRTLREDQENIMRMLQNAGLEISNLYEFFDFKKEDEIKRACDMIKAVKPLGITKVMIIPEFLDEAEAETLRAVCDSYEETFKIMEASENIQRIKTALESIVAEGRRQGIIVHMEDFDSLVSPISRINYLRYFMEQIPGMRYTLDMGNFIFSDEDVEKAYEVLRPYIVHVHCKDRGEEASYADQNRLCKGLAPVPVGKGYMPIGNLVEKLKDFYHGYMAIEHFGAPDQLLYMLESAAYLNRIRM